MEKCRPRLGRDFTRNAKGLLTLELRAVLTNLRGFRFHQHPQIAAPQQRLDLLGELVIRQIERILSN